MRKPIETTETELAEIIGQSCGRQMTVQLISRNSLEIFPWPENEWALKIVASLRGISLEELKGEEHVA